jgi:hypothetical protein
MLNLVFRAVAHWGGLGLATKAFATYGGMGLHPNTDTFNTLLAASVAEKKPVAVLDAVMQLMEDMDKKRIEAAEAAAGGGEGGGSTADGAVGSSSSSTRGRAPPSCKPNGLSYGIFLKAAVGAKDWGWLEAGLQKIQAVKMFQEVPPGWLAEVVQAAYKDGAGQKLAPLRRAVRALGDSRAYYELGVTLGMVEGWGVGKGRGGKGEERSSQDEEGFKSKVSSWSMTKEMMVAKQEARRTAEGKGGQQGREGGSSFAEFLKSSSEADKQEQEAGGAGVEQQQQQQQQQGPAAAAAAGSAALLSPGFLGVSGDADGAMELVKALERGEVKDAAAVAAAAAAEEQEAGVLTSSSIGSSGGEEGSSGPTSSSTSTGSTEEDTLPETVAEPGGSAPGVGDGDHDKPAS